MGWGPPPGLRGPQVPAGINSLTPNPPVPLHGSPTSAPTPYTGPGAQAPAPPAQAPAQAPQAPNTAAVNAFKQSPAYANSVLSVFKAQDPWQQTKIVQASLKNPSTPESKAVLDFVRSTQSGSGKAGGLPAATVLAPSPAVSLKGGQASQGAPSPAQAQGLPALGVVPAQTQAASAPVKGVPLSGATNAVGDVGHFLHGIGLGAHAPSNQQLLNTYAGVGNTVGNAAGSVVDFLHHLPGAQPIGANQKVAQAAGFGPQAVSKNLFKDIASFYAEAPASIGVAVGDALKSPSKGLQDVIGPYKQILSDPQQAFIQHPFLTAMMLGAPIHGGSRLLAAPVRAMAPAGGTLGRIVSTQREPVHLTANLTHDRVPFSKSPSVKYGYQVPLERALYERNAQGQLVPKNDNVRSMLINKSVSSNFQALERVRRADRQQALADRQAAIAPGTGANTRAGRLTALPGQTAHAFTHALSREPGHAAIPHADLLPLVADTTIRGLDSWRNDLQAHRDRIAATTRNIQDNPRLLKDQQETLKTIDAALAKPAPTPKQWARLVGATQSYGHDLHPVVAELHGRGHFGDVTQEGLARRELFHFVHAHMPEARIDPILGMVRTGAADEVRAQITTLRAQAAKLEQRLRRNFETPSPQTVSKIQSIHRAIEQTWATKSVPLATQRVVDAIKKPVREGGTGGRMPVYTPDYMKRGSAYYFPSEKFPRPATAKNTLFAYSHGLTDLHRDALTEHYVRRVGELSAHRAKGEYLNTLVVGHPGGGFYTNPRAAYEARVHDNQVPINIAPMHPANSMEAALHEVNPATVTDEAALRAMDLGAHVAEPGSDAMTSNGGRWGLIDRDALKALEENRKSINPGTLGRAFRGATTLFRTNALSLSAKHIPGVATEDVLRDIQHGVGPRSLWTGSKAFHRYEQLYGTQEARAIRARLGGGQAAGATEALSVHSNIEHYRGTAMHPVLKAWEAAWKTPGPRQIRTAWRAYTKLVIQGTKHVLEEKHQTAALGKHILTQHGYAEAARTGGTVGLVERMMNIQGEQLDNAVRGLHDSPQLRNEARAVQKRFFGDWTDRTPMQRNALMFSPFGMWWANSASFLARQHIDAPVKTGLLASATQGTQQQRQQRGLEMFGPNRLPGYQQGGIPTAGGVLAQNYYSAWGVANNPFETAQSLILPTVSPLLQGALGVNWLGKTLTSPENPRGTRPANSGERVRYILEQLAGLFVPLFQKAQTVAAGGSPTYDTGPFNAGMLNPLAPLAKQPGGGVGAGLSKAFTPYRFYPTPQPKKAKGKSGGSGGGGGGGLSGGGGRGLSGGTGLSGGGLSGGSGLSQ